MRRKLVLCLGGVLVVSVALPFFFKAQGSLRMKEFEQLAVRSGSLVDAIHRYADEHQQAPGSLDELVPDYLSEIPSTGLRKYPEYQYQSSVEEDWDSNPWVLFVNTPKLGINFDRFIYLPLQNYPENGYGGRLERIGRWAYVHE